MGRNIFRIAEHLGMSGIDLIFTPNLNTDKDKYTEKRSFIKVKMRFAKRISNGINVWHL